MNKIHFKIMCYFYQDRFDAGQPTAIKFSLLIAIGTSKGFLILFDSSQTFLWYHEAVGYGAVSALDFNPDCSRLLVGYINGTIIMFDSSSTTSKTLRIMNDAHTPDTAVLHIKVSFKYVCLCYVLILYQHIKTT